MEGLFETDVRWEPLTLFPPYVFKLQSVNQWANALYLRH